MNNKSDLRKKGRNKIVKSITCDKTNFYTLTVICCLILATSSCKKTPQWQMETPEVTVVKVKKEKIRSRSEYIGQAVACNYVYLYARIKG